MSVMNLLFLALFIIICFDECTSVPCNCAETETECAEMFGVKTDLDGNAVYKCKWWQKRGKCKNFDFVDCDEDIDCLWIRKQDETEIEENDLPTTTSSVDQCEEARQKYERKQKRKNNAEQEEEFEQINVISMQSAMKIKWYLVMSVF